MGEVDWPAGFERTPPAERSRNNSFQAAIGQTTKELAAEMDRLGPAKWRASTASGGAHTKQNGLPKSSANPDDPGFVVRWSKDGEAFAVACDASPRLRDNVRTVYLWINETRMRGKRPVTTGESEFAAARLPSGEDVVEATEPPYEILGVSPDAGDAEVREAYRERVQDVHPDRGGSLGEFARVQDARDELLGGES